jgi:Fic family protein
MAASISKAHWLLYSAIRKEAVLTSQIEGTQATLTDLFDEEAGFAVSNTDDVEEVTNYLRARPTQEAQLESVAEIGSRKPSWTSPIVGKQGPHARPLPERRPRSFAVA